MKIFLLVKLFILFNKSSTVSGYSAEDVRSLKTFLFQDYDKDVRPSTDFSKSLFVEIVLAFHEVNFVSETSQIISSSGKLAIRWDDEYLKWNQTHFNIDSILVPAENIWKPDVKVQNGISTIDNSESKTKQVEIGRKGAVNWINIVTFETKCSIDVKLYPFDTQTCDISFVFMNGDGLRITAAEAKIEKTVVKDEWTIEDATSRIINRNNNNKATFKLVIKRKPYRVLLEFVLPVIMMAILDLFTFCIPCDSGEKISYTTTMYLAFSVYTFVLSSYLPESADNAILAVFLKTIMAFLTAIVAITAIQLRIHHHSTNPNPPSWIKGLCKRINKCMCSRSKNEVKVVNEKQLEGCNIENICEADVKKACNNLDTIFFWFFFTAIVITTIVCFAIVST